MESIVVLTHADEFGTTLTRASLETITAGKDLAARLGAPLTVGIIAADPQPLSKGLPCAALAAQGPAFAQSRFASDAAACEALCRAAQSTIVLAPQSSRFARVMAAVAHRLGGFIDTHITSLGDVAAEATRWFYRQRIEAVITRTARPWFLLLDAGTHTPFACDAGNAELKIVPVNLRALRTEVTGLRAPKQDEQTIRPDAKLLFVAGAGWTKKQPDAQVHSDEAAKLILESLRHSGASPGSSKSLVDQGGEGNSVLPFLTHLNQVGQTGSTPRHASERRAISLDPNCGWARGKADVVYVADAFQVIAKLNEKLAKA